MTLPTEGFLIQRLLRNASYGAYDKNAMIAAEYYLDLGMYVVFLHEYYNLPDLLVDYEYTSKQISDELARRSEDKQLPSKIVIISLHESSEVGFKAVSEGYKEAKRKGQVHFPVEFWFRSESGMEIRVLEEEE